MTLTELEIKYGKPVILANHGSITRAIFFNRKTRETAVYFSDGFESFVLYPPFHLTIEAFKAPRAYAAAALNGIENPARLNPVGIAA